MNIINVWLLLNSMLWIAYYTQNPTLRDFGRIQNKKIQTYMLIFATLAYIANFFHVYMLRNSPDNASIILAIISYYILQIFFIPAVRSKNSSLNVKILLFLACIPIYYLAQVSCKRNKKYEILLGTFVLAHVFINDFFLFGHLF